MDATANAEGKNTYEQESARGKLCLAQQDYKAARQHFMRAHALGHGSKSAHLKAHAALLRVGWMQRSPSQVLGQTGLLVLAAIFG